MSKKENKINSPKQDDANKNFVADKSKDFKGSAIRLIKEFSNFKIKVILVIVLAILSAVFNVIGPKLLGEGVNIIFEGIYSPAGIDFGALSMLIFRMLGLYTLSLVFAVGYGILISTISLKICQKFRMDIGEKLSKLPLNYFDKNTTGNTLSRITNDIDKIGHSLSQTMPQFINAVTTVIGVSYMMITIDIFMTGIVFLGIPIALIIITIIVKNSQKFFKAQQAKLGEVNGHIEEAFSGLDIIQIYNNEKDNKEVFKKLNNELKGNQKMAQYISSIMMPMMEFVINLLYVAIVIIGTLMVNRGRISVGNILSFVQYSRNFMQPISQLGQSSTQVQSAIAAAERVFEFLDEKEEDDSSDVEVDLTSILGKVTFENVNFGYEKDKIIINNFNAEIYSGKKIAIVGPTGAGKTTILKLLMRFYEINSGKIKIDGIDISTINRQQLRSLFGIVLQDTWLFNGTIMENLKFGNEMATDEDVYKASKMAHIHHYIMTLPEGYNTVLNEETSNISQGQKQLLTIARAILNNPKILILDEATSSVDTRTEKLIQDATYNLMGDRTSFVIAHRLSTILDADYILVMKDGDIIEKGNHKELMEQDGFYTSLYNSQFAN